MCFGVRDAIALALEHADATPLTILGDLVHNPTVLNTLAAKGVVAVPDISQVKTQTVMVTAHGTSQRTLAHTRALGLTVVEATCPLVHVAHRAVAALVRDGYHVVIVGQRDHVEVRGLTGDLDRFDVVLNDDDVTALEEHPRVTAESERAVHEHPASRRRQQRPDVVEEHRNVAHLAHRSFGSGPIDPEVPDRFSAPLAGSGCILHSRGLRDQIPNSDSALASSSPKGSPARRARKRS